MENYSLKKFLKSPLPLSFLPYVLLGIAGIGFLDAAFLTIEHYRNLIPPCTFHGCDLVLTSSYSTFLGIPIALIGAGFYAVVMILSALFIQTKNKTLRSLLFVLCSMGFLVGLFLIYIQAFVLHAFCQYCLLSELVDFLLFDTSWWLYNS